jgi:glycosyltransferase involved in cell wall biosynthesis
MENKPETLVILTPGFPANEADSACMPPQQVFVKALTEVCPGLNVVVVTFHYPFTTAEYKWNGIKVISLGGKDKGGLSRRITWLKASQILKKLNKEYSLTGLLSFWFGECAFVGNAFAKKHGLTHYSWMLGQDAKAGNKYFNLIKPKGDMLIALSDFIAKEVHKNYGITPMQVIPVGIDTGLFPAEPAKRAIDIFGAGSLIPLKQYHLFVEAISVLKKSFPNIKAVICGKGPELGQLQQMADLLNLQDNLTFAGELPPREVLALMQQSKIFLHPSAYEGFGSVLSEALYAGAHVVSFCKPLAKDYRHHHVVKDRHEMVEELLAILKNPRRGHDRVLMWPVQQVAKNMISLFVD